jgi:hypothetical protein
MPAPNLTDGARAGADLFANAVTEVCVTPAIRQLERFAVSAELEGDLAARDALLARVRALEEVVDTPLGQWTPADVARALGDER